MIKTIMIFTLNLFIFICCYGQPMNMAATHNDAVIVTQTVLSQSELGEDTNLTKLLYTYSSSGDRYIVYKIRDDYVNEATDYTLVSTKTGLYLIVKSLFSNQYAGDSLHIAFNDKKHTIIIGNTDEYTLFPSGYAVIREQIQNKHSILVLLGLLEDNIGDYPLDYLLPLMLGRPVQVGRQIKLARIITKRNQADSIRDTWECTFDYDSNGKIILVKAVADGQVRFRKAISYKSAKISIKTYRNIEDRQITNRIMVYNRREPTLLKWADELIETGKNLQTNSETTLKIMNLKGVKKVVMSPEEVLSLIQQAK